MIRGIPERERFAVLNESLNGIQSDLEELASNCRFRQFARGDEMIELGSDPVKQYFNERRTEN